MRAPRITKPLDPVPPRCNDPIWIESLFNLAHQMLVGGIAFQNVFHMRRGATVLLVAECLQRFAKLIIRFLRSLRLVGVFSVKE